jgi:2-polyprenyl-6-methoxyphenol hydroxylase-like FAD-dependent oxidoreductase
VGLALALGLARCGIEVLVLEKEAGTARHSRAPALWPATQEILARLGVLDVFLREGRVVPRLRFWDVDRDEKVLELDLRELRGETAHPHLLVLPQSRTEALLLDALLREPSAEVRFRVEVTDLAQDARRVEVVHRSAGRSARAVARVVAGCDGAHSTVRRAIGASFDGATYGVRAALADVEMDRGLELPFPRFTTRPRLAVAIRMTDELWRLILPYAASDEVSLEQRVADAVEGLFHTKRSPVWQSEFRLHRRASSRFARGRVVLAGDAAHLNSPVGGQGMNAGIRDAERLAGAIARTLDGGALEPLAAYARSRRREVRGGVNRFTDLLTRALLFGEGRHVRSVLRAGGLALRVGPLRRRFLRRLAMLPRRPAATSPP